MTVSMTKIAIGAAALFTAGTQAQVLLTIDLSVVNEVTISSTGAASAATASGSNFVGIYFEDYFATATTAFPAETLFSGNLTPSNNPSTGAPNLFSFVGDFGLNIYDLSSDGTVSFTAGSEAFSGSTTWGLTASDYARFQDASTFGDIYFAADDVGDLPGAVVIGQYSVIPTAGTLPILGLGLAAMRRRR